eukprot:TRINITY_DN102062_c0_g1_i1.p1 TRINITY_DN102062_c0_g1~~TRINITY_DN102062_c0_g1_i1.p1  ORF type:complete len:313 (-),score=31.93 TRINITY_DN102062_c0_g1_i1:261-1136(-)
MMGFADVAAFLARGSSSDEKHRTLQHPVICCVILYLCMAATGLSADHYLCGKLIGEFPAAPYAILALLWHFSFIVVLRCRGETASVSQDVYHLMFSCNFSMPLAALAIYLQKPVLLCAQGILVAIDQVLWYVDILGYALTGKMPIKVIGYLFWPTTPWSRRITCFHHVLFEPLVVVVLARGDYGIPLGSGFVVALLQTIVCQVICRYTTPLEVDVAKDDKKGYLNINLCHESFRDVKVAWIRRYDGAPAIQYLPWMLWIWNVGNFVLFAVLAVVLTVPLRLAGYPGAWLRV